MTARPWRQCAGCAHQVLQPGTSEAGMHGCKVRGGYRWAYALHDCEAWAPLRYLCSIHNSASIAQQLPGGSPEAILCGPGRASGAVAGCGSGL